MDDFKPNSINGDEKMEMDSYRNKADPNGLRCYSTSYISSSQPQNQSFPKELKLKKGKSALGSSSSSKGGWILGDPELQRKKRVAGYKTFALEGKVKGSLRKSFRWIKERCSQVVNGSW